MNQTKLQWTDFPNAVAGEAIAYTGNESVEEAEFVVEPVFQDQQKPAFFILSRRAKNTLCGFAPFGDNPEFDTIEAAKAAAEQA